MKLLHLLNFSVLSMVVALTAGCGGSGSNSVVNLNPAPTAVTATVKIDKSALAINETALVTAKYVSASGKPLANQAVTFTTTLGALSPSGGIATTDATGSASIQLLPGSTPGSGFVTATTTVDSAKVSKSVSFSVALPPITISTPIVGITTPLPPGGSTGITVTLKDASGALFMTPVDVSFTSNFATAGTATLVSPVTTVNGVASSTYTAAGGVGTDTITVSAGGTGVTATVTVSGPVANSISFVSATPKNIMLKGMGGVGGSETSTVLFKVLDVNSQIKVGQTVDFTLNTTVGGLSLTADSASSDASGMVSTIVKSGIVSTPIRVTATIRGSATPISTQSDQLVVSTGIPAQDGFSLSVVTLNPESFNIDGVTDLFTARLADHFGNPVPDGTAVYFTAQSGSVDPSCTTTNGACSVTWRSQGLRTPDGRAAILAYAVGEESFIDVNGNGFADAGVCKNADPLVSAKCGEYTDTTQAYRDDAHTGKYESSDPFIDFNRSGKVDRDNVFNGILRPTTVSGSLTKHVFSNNVIVMSTSGAVIKPIDATGQIAPATGNPLVAATSVIGITVQDQNTIRNNPVASGSKITFSAGSSCLSIDAGASTFTVPNTTSAPLFYSTSVTNKCAAGGSGLVTVTATSPGGLVTYQYLTLNW